MIGRKRAEFGRQRGAVQVGQLIGMQPDRQPQRACGSEQSAGFRGAEADALAEGIHGIEQALRMQPRQPVRAHRIDIGGALLGEFGRHGVQRQQRTAHFDTKLRTQAPRHAQHACLAVERQRVAGFDLDSGDAFTQQCAGARQGGSEQGLFAGGAGGAHRGHDAAAGARDGLIADTFQALLELAGAVAGENQMRVRVDQARSDQGVARVECLPAQIVERSRQLRARPQPQDAPVAPGQCAVLDQAMALGSGQCGQACVQQQAAVWRRGVGAVHGGPCCAGHSSCRGCPAARCLA